MDKAEAAASLRGLARSCGRRAPLYARLAAALAERDEALSLLVGAPPTHRAPVTLLAAVHYLLLADPEHPLAAWYPNLTATPRADDPVEAFIDFLGDHRRSVADLVATRVPQTNEIGRSALLLVGLASLTDLDRPLAQVDVGASAGLNLLLEHYGYDYSGHRLGGDRLVLTCAVAGSGRLPTSIPAFGAHYGLDRNPIDLAAADQVRWLEACVWPDQSDRFERLRTAIAIAREHPVQLRAGDAVADLAATLDQADTVGHPVVTTSWVLPYLTVAERSSFHAELDRWGAQADLSWVFAESPSAAAGIPSPQGLADPTLTVLGTVSWRRGVRTVRHLATCHPHGYTLRWL